MTLDEKLIELSAAADCPIYVVGGYVRNFYLDGKPSEDVDLCAPALAEELTPLIKKCGFNVLAEYSHTGTILFTDGDKKYEFTSFRKDCYGDGGRHRPDSVSFTDDMLDDALRRDFKCNAVYYDIKNGKIIDPLNGIEDIKNRELSTIRDSGEVFCHDGLRLLRLARFVGELGFYPSPECLESAKNNADKIEDIAKERIFAELKKMLVADEKYPFSPSDGHYRALKILSETRVLDRMIPELTLGRDLSQRADYHKYDVLEHSLRCVLYSKPKVRLPALFHDVGKPYNKLTTGEYYGHEKSGEKLAKNALNKLGADKKTIEQVAFLTRYHMFDIKCDVKESKLRKFFVGNEKYLFDLLDLKQADFRAGLDSDQIVPCEKKWIALYEKMKTDGTPFSYSDLKITAEQLMEMGFKGKQIGAELKKLFDLCVYSPRKNNEETLKKIVEKDYNKLTVAEENNSVDTVGEI